MKKIFLFTLLFLISCKNEYKNNRYKDYENRLKGYLIKELEEKQKAIDYEIKYIKDNLEDFSEPKLQEYKSYFKTISHLNKICLEFHSMSMKSDNLYEINQSLKIIKGTIAKNKTLKNFYRYSVVLKNITEIKYDIDKYQINRELKVIVLGLLEYVNNKDKYDDTKCFVDVKTLTKAIRLNKSTVLININNSFAANSPEYFDYNSFKIRKLKDLKSKENIYFESKNFRSYVIKTESDTIIFKASLKTKKKINFTISKIDTIIVVGKEYLFSQNNKFYEYLKNN